MQSLRYKGRGCVSVLSFRQTLSLEIIFLYFLLPYLILEKKVPNWVVSKLKLIENSALACCTSNLTWNRLRSFSSNPQILFMVSHDAISPVARLIKCFKHKENIFLGLRLAGCHENALKLIFAFCLLSEDQRNRS